MEEIARNVSFSDKMVLCWKLYKKSLVKAIFAARQLHEKIF